MPPRRSSRRAGAVRALCGAALAVALAACGGARTGNGDTVDLSDGGPVETVSATPSAAGATSRPTATGTEPTHSRASGTAGRAPDGVLTSELEQVLADVADRTGAAPAEIRVVLREFVTWRNGSLGCSGDVGSVTQALVDGYRIVVEVAGRQLAYHGASGGPPQHCADPAENATVPS